MFLYETYRFYYELPFMLFSNDLQASSVSVIVDGFQEITVSESVKIR